MIRIMLETRWTNWSRWHQVSWGRFRKKHLKLVQVTIAELTQYQYAVDGVLCSSLVGNEEFTLTVGAEHESVVKSHKTEAAALRRLYVSRRRFK